MRRVHLLVLALTTICLTAASGCASSEARNIGNVHTVTSGVLIRGSQPDEQGLRELRTDFGVRTVIHFNDVSNDSQAPLAARTGLKYLPLRDNPWVEAGDRELHLSFLKTVRDAKRSGEAPVYVHCKNGHDRVGLAVGIYRIVECGWNARQALSELRRYQPLLMSMVYYRYPAILRDVERDRSKWLAELENAPDPPIQTAGPNPR
jgi:protein tyrosine/serine phosphatase